MFSSTMRHRTLPNRLKKNKKKKKEKSQLLSFQKKFTYRNFVSFLTNFSSKFAIPLDRVCNQFIGGHKRLCKKFYAGGLPRMQSPLELQARFSNWTLTLKAFRRRKNSTGELWRLGLLSSSSFHWSRKTGRRKRVILTLGLFVVPSPTTTYFPLNAGTRRRKVLRLILTWK